MAWLLRGWDRFDDVTRADIDAKLFKDGKLTANSAANDIDVSVPSHCFSSLGRLVKKGPQFS